MDEDTDLVIEKEDVMEDKTIVSDGSVVIVKHECDNDGCGCGTIIIIILLLRIIFLLGGC